MKLKGHVIEKWQTRTNSPLANGGEVQNAWEEAEEIKSGTLDGGELRYHDGENVILVYRNKFIRTVLDASWEEFRAVGETARCSNCGENLVDIETCPQCGEWNPSKLRQ